MGVRELESLVLAAVGGVTAIDSHLEGILPAHSLEDIVNHLIAVDMEHHISVRGSVSAVA